MGASGYTGSELLRILLKHPNVKIIELIGEKSSGKNISEIFSSFHGIELPTIKSFENSNLSEIITGRSYTRVHHRKRRPFRCFSC